MNKFDWVPMDEHGFVWACYKPHILNILPRTSVGIIEPDALGIAYYKATRTYPLPGQVQVNYFLTLKSAASWLRTATREENQTP